jgi:hypothetical protein
MIDQVYQITKTIYNKELRGNLTPDEFNQIGNQVQQRIFRNYFEDENRDKNRENRGLTNNNYAHLSFNQRQRIEVFETESTLVYNNTTNRFDLPDNLYIINDEGLDFNGCVISETEADDIRYLLKSIAAPTEIHPVYRILGNSIRVYPDSIVTNVTCSYLRKPLPPRWTYQVINGVEMFDNTAADFQDFELHPSELTNIVVHMLSFFGINLRETEVTQYAEALKQKQDKKEES